MALLEKVQAQVSDYVKEEVAKMVSENVDQQNNSTKKVEKTILAFTAPDGVTFSNEKEYKKYMYANFYSFTDRVGEKCLRVPGEIRGQSFDLYNLKNCEVQLLDHTGQVFADDLVDCKVYIGACGADVFVRNCKNCEFTIACKQLRIRDCSHSKMYLYSATRPALETSHHIQLGPFNGSYPRQAFHFRQAKLDPKRNQWEQVHDFSRSCEDVPKPHWSPIEDKDWEAWECKIPGSNAKCENPVSRQSDALWFTQGQGNNAPVMGIKKQKGGMGSQRKSLFNRIGPKLK